MAVQSPLLRNSRGGLNVFFNNKFLYSEYNPSAGAERAAGAATSSLPVKSDTLYILPSPLLWHGLETVLKVIPQQNIIAVEMDKELYKISVNSCKNVRIFLGEDLDIHVLQGLKGWPYRRVELIPLNGGYREQQQSYERLRKSLVSWIQEYWRNRLTLQHLVPLWIRNIFRNLSAGDNCFPLKDLRTEKPVIVAGAGESLEQLEHIDCSRVFILAIDTALGYFEKKNIRPDAILAVDGQFYNFLDFIGTHLFRTVPLIMDITLYPAIRRIFSSKKYVFMTEFWNSSLIKRLRPYIPDTFEAFGSVGVAGIETALSITRKEVYTVGLDFCYSLGKTHAKGTTYADLSFRQRTRVSPYPGILNQLNFQKEKTRTIDGSLRYTDKQLSSYAGLIRRRNYPKNRVRPILGPSLDMGLIPVEVPITGDVEHVRAPGSEMPRSGPLCGFSDFLINEFRLLESLYEAAYTLLSTGKGADTFIKAYKNCDYPGLHIPDMNIENPHPTQLKRLLVTVKLYMQTISADI